MKFSEAKVNGLFVATLLLILAGSVLKLTLLPVESRDMRDFLVPWLRYVKEHGGYHALARGFSNYFPAYNYILVALSYLPNVVPDAWLIKLSAVPFEWFAGLTAYRITAACRRKDELGPVWGSRSIPFLAIVLLPTVILNASAWGQCDMIYSSFLLASVYHLMRQNPWRACFWLGMALSFKLQTILLGPFVLLMLLQRRVSVVQLGVVPLVVAALSVPTILAGRPVHEVAAIYWEQAGMYTKLGLNVANPWTFVPQPFHAPGFWLSLALAGIATLAYVAIGRRRARLDAEWMLFAAALSLTLMPYMLPRMHDRYFFPAEIFWTVLAVVRRSCLVPALLMEMAALLVYSNFLIAPPLPVRAASVAVAALLTSWVLVWAWGLYRKTEVPDGRAGSAPSEGAAFAPS